KDDYDDDEFEASVSSVKKEEEPVKETCAEGTETSKDEYDDDFEMEGTPSTEVAPKKASKHSSISNGSSISEVKSEKSNSAHEIDEVPDVVENTAAPATASTSSRSSSSRSSSLSSSKEISLHDIGKSEKESDELYKKKKKGRFILVTQRQCEN
ncbi:uncharacterized protein TM35_000111680, partial [Trypanosoma theileri]